MTNADVKTTSELKIGFPEMNEGNLRFAVGACRLYGKPGEPQDWIRGTYNDPTGTLPCRVLQEGDSLRITQEFTPLEFWSRFATPPMFDLSLGKAKPYSLELGTGASDVKLDLGGLPLTRMELKHGAGKVELDFSQPNPQAMSILNVASGAGSTALFHLANANFTEMRLEGGAAGYQLDFGGVLRRDAHVKIQTGLAEVQISIPAFTAARVITGAVMGSLEIGDGFTKKDGAFVTPAALEHHTPLLTIEAQVAIGALKVRATRA
jgi:hypothetical protein